MIEPTEKVKDQDTAKQAEILDSFYRNEVSGWDTAKKPAPKTEPNGRLSTD
jgi:hypothetical protein